MATKKTTTDRKTIESEPVKIIPETSENILEKDEFADPSFIDPDAKLPRIQALRGTNPNFCGYFISSEQMAKAGWLNMQDYEDKLITYTFESSGEEEKGLLLPSPRMLVCPRTYVLAYDRKASQESEELVIVGVYRKEYKQDENIGNLQFFEVFLLDEKNQPLHQVPFAYCAKGANQATFSIEWQKFIDEITSCHAITNGIAARGKDKRFKSLCVFCFQTKRELAGDKQKSFACKVISHEVPSLQNWRNYFIGFNPLIKQMAWEGLQPTLPLIVPGVKQENPVASLPTSDTPNFNDF